MDIGWKNGMMVHARTDATSMMVNTGTQIMDVNAIMKQKPGKVILMHVDAIMMNISTGMD